MSFGRPDCVAHHAARLFPQGCRIEKTEVPGPGDVNQQTQAVFGSQIEKPRWWHIIYAQNICAEFHQLPKVTLRLPARRKAFIVLVRCERAVGDPFYAKLPVTRAKELPINFNLHRFVEPCMGSAPVQRGPTFRLARLPARRVARAVCPIRFLHSRGTSKSNF